MRTRCILATLGAAAFIILSLVGAFFLTSAAIKSTDVMQEALARARKNAAVADTLGAPVELGWYVTGSVTNQASFGDADVSVRIAGPKRGGTLFATARRTNGVWDYLMLTVAVDGRSDVIDLR